MKKTNKWKGVNSIKFYFLLVAASVCVASCGDDDDDDKQSAPIVSEDHITLKALVHGEDCEHQIEVEGNETCTFISEDTYVATVDANGYVRSVCCGETDIQVQGENGTTLVKVNVNPVYFTYPEPSFTWNTKYSEVFSHYGSKAIAEEEEEYRAIGVYDYSPKVPMILYVFDKVTNKLIYYSLVVEKRYQAELLLFLAERYLLTATDEETSSTIFFDGFTTETITTGISVMDASSLGDYIICRSTMLYHKVKKPVQPFPASLQKM